MAVWLPEEDVDEAVEEDEDDEDDEDDEEDDGEEAEDDEVEDVVESDLAAVDEASALAGAGEDSLRLSVR